MNDGSKAYRLFGLLESYVSTNKTYSFIAAISRGLVLILNTLEDLNLYLSNHTVVIVYASRLWCGVCQMTKPELLTWLNQNPHWPVVEINLDQVPDFSEHYSVKSAPSVLVFYENALLHRQEEFINISILDDLMHLLATKVQ